MTNTMLKMMTPAQAVDEKAAVKAEMAEMRAYEKQLDKILLEVGEDRILSASRNLEAVIVHSERETLDMKAVRAKLSPQFIRAHTKVTDVVSIRINTRNKEAA